MGCFFVGINLLALTILRTVDWPTHFMLFFIWIVCAAYGHRFLNQYLPRRDQLLFPLIMFLSGWGLVAIQRLAPRFGERQAIWLVIAVMGMLFVAIYPHLLRWMRNYRYLWLTFGLSLLVITILLGRNPSGIGSAPQLWLGIGNVNFQPSELLKVVLVVFLSSYLAEQYPTLRAQELVTGNRLLAFSPRVFGPILLMWSLSIVILIWQRDLGTAILFFAVFTMLLYAASGDWLVMVGGALLIVIAAIIAYRLFDVVSLRIDIWIDPWSDADGRAFQIVQSLQAFAAGGIFGQGIGQGLPTAIPVVHSDFIFAAVAEEWGLLGVVVVVASIGFIIVRGFRIAIMHYGYPFHALLALGLTLLLTTQALLIMGGVIRLLPLTGVTLPFMSYGGSSLVMSFVMLGLLLRLSDQEVS